MGEHFYSVVLPRIKKVLVYDKSGISKELKTPHQTSSATPLKEGNIDIAETLSNLTGKWIKKISKDV